MKTVTRTTLVLLFLALAVSSLSAQQIRMASLAPENSPWGVALNRVAADWQRISGGRVRLQIYHNMVAGNEADVIRKMRIGQIQAAVVTSIGLNNISPEIMALHVPMLIRTDEELDYVFDRVRPTFERSIEAQRMRAIGWSKGGWIHFFAKNPIRTPAELKRLRLAANADDPGIVQVFRAMGYQPVPIELSEIMTSLNSGLVDAFYASTIATAGFQWFGLAPYMLDVTVSPFLGAIIITDRAWAQIPDSLKPELQASLDRHIAQLDRDVARLEAEAIELMKRFGLTVIELTAAETRAWQTEMEDIASRVVGSVFDRNTYEAIKRHLDEFRR
ncbi:MAG: C4-dicarboxylate ABC transporter [Spirochaetaceae bacterium]|nr:MAG: C4-dicarboxylate ABC transporter [Spirochaetaceae bacterium]